LGPVGLIEAGGGGVNGGLRSSANILSATGSYLSACTQLSFCVLVSSLFYAWLLYQCETTRNDRYCSLHFHLLATLDGLDSIPITLKNLLRIS
jgi:hypothetical protein